jgi:hypothetical protein
MIAPTIIIVKIIFLFKFLVKKPQNDRCKKDHLVNMEMLSWIHHCDWGGLFNNKVGDYLIGHSNW